MVINSFRKEGKKPVAGRNFRSCQPRAMVRLGIVPDRYGL